MIGLDSNVLLRYLVQDDPFQSRRAAQLIEGELTVDEQGFVSLVALAETVWVLERAYRLSDEEIAAVVRHILQIEAFVIESEPEVVFAFEALEEKRGSFADALIAALGAKAGCSHTVTFDRRALRLAGFAPL
jgi:predicted nucleic-acid-binding protein